MVLCLPSEYLSCTCSNSIKCTLSDRQAGRLVNRVELVDWKEPREIIR